MAVPLFPEFSGKMNAARFFEITRLSVWAGSNEKSKLVKKISPVELTDGRPGGGGGQTIARRESLVFHNPVTTVLSAHLPYTSPPYLPFPLSCSSFSLLHHPSSSSSFPYLSIRNFQHAAKTIPLLLFAPSYQTVHFPPSFTFLSPSPLSSSPPLPYHFSALTFLPF
jgi:hypothetical protein